MDKVEILVHQACRRYRQGLGQFGVLLLVFVGALAILSVSRALLALWQWERIVSPGVWWVFALGLRMDTILISYLIFLPSLFYLALPARRGTNTFIAVLLTCLGAFIGFMELCTPAFVVEYDKRPDRLFVEYLIYPREVFAMLWGNHKLALFSTPIITAALVFCLWRGLRSLLATTPSLGRSQRLAAIPLLTVMLFLGARSSLSHRPANISTASFSSNRLTNEIALNSSYSMLWGAYGMTREQDSGELYGSMPWDEVQSRVRAGMKVAESSFVDVSIPTLHRQTAASRQPRNLVIFLQESLGASYVGYLGGKPLTPNIDRLRHEGLSFTNLFATGTRTARGIEATVAGFPPSPAPAVLKLPRAQGEFFTLAALLADRGYSTQFIYGGRARFDNMRGFAIANGFNRFIEQDDFEAPRFVASWGVSDEDLVERANEEFKAHGGEPFFAVILSSSNHDPFEIPEGAIEPFNEPLYTRENAIKYADLAVGRFFELAEQEDYFDNTVFIVLADHDARVFGLDLIPVEHFRVPALIIGPDVPKGTYDAVASQIDIPPTLLHFLGLDVVHPMIGRNLMTLGADEPGRALMQYGANQGFRVGNLMAVLRPHQRARTFRIDQDRLMPIDHDEELERDALAHALWTSGTYSRQLYRGWR